LLVLSNLFICNIISNFSGNENVRKNIKKTAGNILQLTLPFPQADTNEIGQRKKVGNIQRNGQLFHSLSPPL
jgi:hypothetical protein